MKIMIKTPWVKCMVFTVAVTVLSSVNMEYIKADGAITPPIQETQAAAPAQGGQAVSLTAENFPDEYLRKLVVKHDINSDGILDEKELSGITKLNIRKYPEPDEVPEGERYPDYNEADIKFDCKGIELLPNLTNIFMNLSATKVEASGDTKFFEAEIKNLDVIKQLESLKTLEIHWGKLDTFDASVYKGLNKLAISSERLTSINLASDSLTNLYLYANLNKASEKEITELDFRKAVKLKKVDISSTKVRNIKFGKKNKTIKEFYWEIYGNKAYAPKSVSFKYLTGLTKAGLTNLKFKQLSLVRNRKIKELILTDVFCGKIKLAKNNSIASFRWDESKYKKLNVINLNPKKLKTFISYDSKIKTLDFRKFKKLKSVIVGKKTKVLLPKGVSQKIISRL